MTDTQLERRARETLNRVEGLNNIHDDDTRAAVYDVLLAALKSVQNSPPVSQIPTDAKSATVQSVNPSPPSAEPADAANRESDALRAEVLQVLEPFARRERASSLNPEAWVSLNAAMVAASSLHARLSAALPICDTPTEEIALKGLPDLGLSADQSIAKQEFE